MPTVNLGPEGSVSVKLNGSGAGTVKVGPLGPREVWQPMTATVSTNPNPQNGGTNEAQCSIYVGPSVAAAYLVDGTFSGSSGDSSDRVSSQSVKLGNYVWAVWTGGDANALATLNVDGTKTI